MDRIFDDILKLSRIPESPFLIDEFLQELLKLVTKNLDSEFGSVIINDTENKLLTYKIGFKREFNSEGVFYREFSTIKIGNCAAGQCASQRKTLNFKEPGIPAITGNFYKSKFELETISVLCSPMLSRGELVGVLEIVNKSGGEKFDGTDEKLLRLFSHYAAITIDNSRLLEKSMVKERLSNLGQSIMNSAHGLKNILNNMDGGAFIVEKGALSKNLDDVNKGWDILKRNSQRLRELVLDIIFYSRPKKPEYIPSDINRICDDLKELLSKSAEFNNVEVHLDLDRSIRKVCFDPVGIHRCILNLVSNAIYACGLKGGGRVNITTRINDENKLEIIVSDNGVGIGKDNLEHIFDVFFTTKGSKGTGLGLAVTKKIINEHHGTIEVKSRLHVGTKFKVQIPDYDCERGINFPDKKEDGVNLS